MSTVRCECGHTNPHGTEICEVCGKPFDEKNQGLLEMRYEGAARRSQTYQRTIVDQVWHFFSSVKVGIWFLFLTLLAASLGTIYPQQMYIPSNAIPIDYYPDQYGIPGYIYVSLGFHNLYSSWWFIALLVLIGISLTIASIDRAIPLYRSLKRQRVTRHISFLRRQRIHGKANVTNAKHTLQLATEQLKKQRFNVRQEDQSIMGEKGRLSRWGPYVVHIGLIILLIGALLRITLPGFTIDDNLWVRDGETVPVHATGGQYFIESEGFVLQLYEKEQEEGRFVPEEFITEAVLYENVTNENTGERQLKQVKRHTIRVNHPMEYEGLLFYQMDYRLNEFSQFTFNVTHKETGELIGEVAIDLHNPSRQYELRDGHVVNLIDYFPDFLLNRHNEPTTRSEIPNNPAFIFEVVSPEVPEGEKSWIFVGQRVEMPGTDPKYELSINNVEFSHVTGLSVRQESSLPVIFTGLAITMLGLILCFYWQHRRMWIQHVGDEIWVSAHTNKNWFGMKREVEGIIDYTQLEIDKDSLDKEEQT